MLRDKTRILSAFSSKQSFYVLVPFSPIDTILFFAPIFREKFLMRQQVEIVHFECANTLLKFTLGYVILLSDDKSHLDYFAPRKRCTSRRMK